MPSILGANTLSGGFDVANSLRFNSGSSDYLTRTFGTPTSSQKWTLSFWIKRCKIGSANEFIFNTDGGNEEDRLSFNGSGDTLTWYEQNSSGGTVAELTTSQSFRDPSAWYHIVLARDSTQGTASNRIKLYVNGSQVTALGTATYPSQNDSSRFNTAVAHEIGARNAGTFVNLYMSEVTFIDGLQLAADSFGEFDSDSGIWRPIDVSDLTFGDNGFYLDFEDSSALGDDVSGNDNDFTVNNLTAVDQSTDTCTNNFATLNPLIVTAYGSELSNGNLDCVQSDVRGRFHNVTTIGASSGKYYAEIKLTGGSNHVLGVATDASFTYASTLLTSGFNYLGQSGTLSYSYYVADGTVYVNGTNSAHGATLTTNDILGIYLDLDNHKLYFSKNGTLQSSTGIDIPTGYDYFFGVGDLGTGDSGEVSCNFGSPSYAISSSNTDDNGYGNFEYSPNITGDSVAKKFYSLNTKNLAEYG